MTAPTPGPPPGAPDPSGPGAPADATQPLRVPTPDGAPTSSAAHGPGANSPDATAGVRDAVTTGWTWLREELRPRHRGFRLARLNGANPDILRMTPNDAPKQTAMGAVLLATAGMACLSATYALTAAANFPWWLAVPVGVVWGVVILVLDRMLVLGMTRGKGILVNILTALPRIALAVVIGAVISVPLVLRIFEPEINSELRVLASEEQSRIQNKLNTQYQRIPELETVVIPQAEQAAAGLGGPQASATPEVKAAQDAFDAKSKEFTAAENAVICENQGGNCPGGSGQAGRGSLYFDKVAQRDRLAGERDEAKRRLDAATAAARSAIGAGAGDARAAGRQQLDTARAELADLTGRKRGDEIAAAEAAENNTGLLARLKALDRLGSGTDGPVVPGQAPDPGDATLAAAQRGLFLLFLSIELLPVLVKFLSGFGRPTTYEQILADREKEAEDTERERREAEEGRRKDIRDAAAQQRQADLAAENSVNDHQRDHLTGLLKTDSERANERYVKDLESVTKQVQKAWRKEAHRTVQDQIRQRFIPPGGQGGAPHRGAATAQPPQQAATAPPPQQAATAPPHGPGRTPAGPAAAPGTAAPTPQGAGSTAHSTVAAGGNGTAPGAPRPATSGPAGAGAPGAAPPDPGSAGRPPGNVGVGATRPPPPPAGRHSVPEGGVRPVGVYTGAGRGISPAPQPSEAEQTQPIPPVTPGGPVNEPRDRTDPGAPRSRT